MTSDESHPDYFFGNTDAEHERLIRQAIRLTPVTERFFREAGIAPGHRVLELGSGVGDVAMLVARIIGRSGEVVAVERDARTISRARARAADAGLHNINFVETDIAEYSADSSFDAAVGRCILQFLPDPVAALRSVVKQVRPDGIVAFQEVSWAPCLTFGAPATLVQSRFVGPRGRYPFRREYGDGPALQNAFQEAGLPAPRMRLEMELRRDPDFTRWVSDLLRSVLPQIQKLNLLHEALGDFDTLQGRLQDEVAISNTVVPWIGLVAAWCRKPVN